MKELKNLWLKTFEDKEEYLDCFFENVFKTENTLVEIRDNKIAAALYMIPYKLVENGVVYNIIYLYALATDDKYKNQGIMTKLIEKARIYAKDNEYAGICLIPASAELIKFYEKRNFRKLYEFWQIHITKEVWYDIKNKYNLKKASKKEERLIYNELNNKKSGFRVSENVFNTMCKEYDIYGIDIFTNEKDMIIAEINEHEVIIYYSDIILKNYPNKCKKTQYIYSDFDMKNKNYADNYWVLLQ